MFQVRMLAQRRMEVGGAGRRVKQSNLTCLRVLEMEPIWQSHVRKPTTALKVFSIPASHRMWTECFQLLLTMEKLLISLLLHSPTHLNIQLQWPSINLIKSNCLDKQKIMYLGKVSEWTAFRIVAHVSFHAAPYLKCLPWSDSPVLSSSSHPPTKVFNKSCFFHEPCKP